MSREALIVGINRYEQLQPLQGVPTSDAEAMARRLEGCGDFRVRRLPETAIAGRLTVDETGGVSTTDVEKALRQLFLPDGRNVPDTALFYFSGHGLRKGQEPLTEGFLATSDVHPDRGQWGISLEWLRKLLQASPVRQQVVWLDCCYSGELFNTAAANPGESGQARDRCFIAASRSYEVAYTDISEPHSVLTKALLSGLDPTRITDGWIDDRMLVAGLDRRLKQETQQYQSSTFGEPIHLVRRLSAPVEDAADISSPDLPCPYKGLEYFNDTKVDAGIFFGRAPLIDRLIDAVRQQNFIAIVGTSGSGKSSVMRAGLLYQLRQGGRLSGSQDWAIYILDHPGDRPLSNLAQVFVDPEASGVEQAKQLAAAEETISQGGAGLRRLVQVAGADKVLLAIDQFEEAFTLCHDEIERQDFFRCLMEGLEQSAGKLCLVLTMRADFVGKCFEQDYSGLSGQVEANTIVIPRMGESELRQTIVKPAQLVGLTVEPELVEQLLEDMETSPGRLPLMQDALWELWQRRENNCLKLKTYIQDLDGVKGTLQRRAEKVYHSFPEQERDAVRHIFLSLTQLGKDAEDTRRRVLQRGSRQRSLFCKDDCLRFKNPRGRKAGGDWRNDCQGKWKQSGGDCGCGPRSSDSSLAAIARLDRHSSRFTAAEKQN